jgi:hypothetical protein
MKWILASERLPDKISYSTLFRTVKEKAPIKNIYYDWYNPNSIEWLDETADQQQEELIEALRWYGEQANAMSRYFNNEKPNADGMVAVATALSLDAGNKANKAIFKNSFSKPSPPKNSNQNT